MSATKNKRAFDPLLLDQLETVDDSVPREKKFTQTLQIEERSDRVNHRGRTTSSAPGALPAKEKLRLSLQSLHGSRHSQVEPISAQRQKLDASFDDSVFHE